MYLVNTNDKQPSTSLPRVSRARHAAFTISPLQSVWGVRTTPTFLAKFHSHELKLSQILTQPAAGLQGQVRNIFSPV